MSTNDILIKAPGAFGTIGTRRYLVNIGATTINPGEPVVLAALPPYQYVAAMATSKPAVDTDYVVGIAQSTGTASGTVDVFPAVTGVIYSIKPATAATYGLGTTLSQAAYNQMIGYRVTMGLSAGAYTLNATDGNTNGCIVEYVDVTKAQGRVSFSLRVNATYFGR